MSVPLSHKSTVLLVAERGFGRCRWSLGPVLYLLNLSCFSKVDLLTVWRLGFGLFCFFTWGYICFHFLQSGYYFSSFCLQTALFLFSCEISHVWQQNVCGGEHRLCPEIEVGINTVFSGVTGELQESAENLQNH